MDRHTVATEMERARRDFHDLVDSTDPRDLRRRSDGTRWTNGQLLFHMLFGYLVVRALLGLVRTFARLPDGVSRGFAAVLEAGTRPFHVVNYVGSLGGRRVLGRRGMERLMDRVVLGLGESLARASDEDLDLGMHFPVGWDPYFREWMSVLDVYHYATQHYDHHRRQLTLTVLRR
jgi:hypothetical protein